MSRAVRKALCLPLLHAGRVPVLGRPFRDLARLRDLASGIAPDE